MFTISDVSMRSAQPLVFVNAALCSAIGAQPREARALRLSNLRNASHTRARTHSLQGAPTQLQAPPLADVGGHSLPSFATRDIVCPPASRVWQLLGQQLLDVLRAPNAKQDTEHETLYHALVHCKDCLARIESVRRSGEAFTSLCALRHFVDAHQAPRFALSLHVELKPGQPVKQLVEKMAKLMKLMPYGQVPLAEPETQAALRRTDSKQTITPSVRSIAPSVRSGSNRA